MKEKWNRLKEAALLIKKGYGVLFQMGFGPMLFCSAGAAAIAAIAPLVTLYFSGQIIDELTGQREPERLLWLAVLTVSLNLMFLLLRHLLTRRKEGYESIAWDNIYMLYSRKILSMDYEDVENVETHEHLDKMKQMQNWGGHGLYRLCWIIDGLVEGTVGVICSFAMTMGLFLAPVGAVSGPAAFFASPWGTALIIGLLVVSFFVFRFCAAKNSQAWSDMGDSMTLINRLLSYFYFMLPEDHKQGKDIRLYGEAPLIQSEMDNGTRIIGETLFPVAKTGLRLGALDGGMSYLVSLFVYLVVTAKAWCGAIGIGGVVQYVGAVSRFAGSFQKLSGQISDLTANNIHLKDTFAFLDMENKKQQGEKSAEKGKNGWVVEFHDVSFRYPGTEAWALCHLNLTLKTGERLAVVGRNGSGKTTMIKLLCRLYDPTEGYITLNGVDIREYRYQEYLELFSVVFQDFHLFSFELGQCVAAGIRYEEEKVMAVLEEAELTERVKKMPHGLHTILDKNFDQEGVEVSGGEAQKIAIARALYKDAPFLVLDEPTAALDPVAEFEVYRKFSQIAENKTSVCISHRLSSCRFCDRIAVFREGELVQIGSHEALLLETEGVYRELWDAQAQYYAPEEQAVLLSETVG